MHDGICNVFLCLCWALLSQSVHSYHLNAFVQLFQLWNPSSDWEEMYHSEYSIFLVSRFQRDSFSLQDILAIFPSFLLFLFSPFLYLNSPIFFCLPLWHKKLDDCCWSINCLNENLLKKLELSCTFIVESIIYKIIGHWILPVFVDISFMFLQRSRMFSLCHAEILDSCMYMWYCVLFICTFHLSSFVF